MNTEWIDQILEKHGYRHSEIIGIMQDLQEIENYLPQETLRYISGKLELRLTRIFDIATFYKCFSLKPRGRHIIKVCCGTACHLGGAKRNLEQIKRMLHIEEGETTDDRNFSLETVNCLGACALAPVTVVDKDYYDAVHPGKIEKILSKYYPESKRSPHEQD
ncbi:MAG: NAD(P)H-dependent oxidoreductase subunit E [Thermodesulfobacteriota bacterium]